ncbi:serine/threonine-protein phosphatase 6 regulatory ankyrin repeat subunit A-like [Episyrphus balteatus]|uniref:serine/threonine-protein phosphatase 6 regulatory ankyrin repeat subunit A-like n=1 Tax=Episyrphus balteatus TaxID=286459 RepID=UPI00248574BF|nr:serine/threonine-protein phosphatase 6 regulatory ankyrin repeat subunit A-like [Episyrphus balteatus]
MSEINKDFVFYVKNGYIEVVRDLINEHGLQYSVGYGYILLLKSIKRKYNKITELLLNAGCKVNRKRNKRIPSDTPLHLAIENGDLKLTETLIDHGADMDANNECGLSPIVLAIIEKKEEIIDLLITKMTNINYTCKEGISPLHVAVEYGLYHVTEKLLQSGAHVNIMSTNRNRGCTPLHYATVGGDLAIVKLLLDNGACVHLKTVNGLTPFHTACQNGNVEIIKLLLSRNADINSRTYCYMFTPLYIAIENSHREAAKYLMDHGAKINDKSDNKKTALSCAVEKGLSLIVQDILQYSPDINNAINKISFINAASKPDKKYLPIVKDLMMYGFSVEADDINDIALLQNALKMGYIEIIQDLVKHGLDLNSNKEENFHIAVKNKQLQLAKLLLMHEPDVNAIDENGKPPIFYSVQNSDLDMYKLILLHGGNVNKCPDLLSIAVRTGCKEIFDHLIENKVDIEASDEFGRTPLHFTVLHKYSKNNKNIPNNNGENTLDQILEYQPFINKTKEMAKILLSMGANVNAPTYNNNLTPLHIACEEGFASIIEILLEYKSDVNCISSNGTPLHFAAKNDNEFIIEMLLANKANIDFRNNNGDTALHIAAKYDNTNVLKTLLKNGAYVDSKNTKLVTPLHVALENKKIETFSILLDHGSSIDAKDIDGNTVLHKAIIMSNIHVVKSLLKFGSDINILNTNNLTPFDLADNLRYSHLDQCLKYANTNYRSLYGVFHDDSKNIETFKMLLLHAIKLKVANLYDAKDENDLVYSYLDEEDYDLLESHGEKCTKEIVQLKLQNVSSLIPLHVAVENGLYHVTEKLLKNGAYVNIMSTNRNRGYTPLHYATVAGDLAIVKLLLDNGACVHLKTVNGLTPFHTACQNGNVEIIKLLLSRNADINSRTYCYMFTPLYFAIENSHKFLMDHGAKIKSDNKNDKEFIFEMLLANKANIDIKNKYGDTALHIAAKYDNTNILKTLLKNGAYVDSKNTKLVTPLHVAIEFKRLETFSILLDHGSSIDAKDIDGNTVLHKAIIISDIPVIECLLDFGSDINILNTNNLTPFDLADNLCYSRLDIGLNQCLQYANTNYRPLYGGFNDISKNIETFKIMLFHAIKLKVANLYDTKDENDFYLYLDTEDNDLLESHEEECTEEIVKLKLQNVSINHGDVQNVRNLINRHGLHNSVAHGYILLLKSIKLKNNEITELLLNEGSRVNRKRNKRIPSNTPLHLAIENGNLKITEMLLDKGADIDADNKNGYSPLILAIFKNNEEIIDLLIRKKANLNYTCLKGLSALHATMDFSLCHLTQKLLQNGAYINIISTNSSDRGFTPLHYATFNGNIAIIKVLLKYGADVDVKEENGFTPLHIACAKGNVEIIELLLTKNVDVNSLSYDKMTPLYIAVSNSHRDVAKCLMNHRAEINVELYNITTVLSCAVEKGLSLIVEDILQHHPDLESKINKKSFIHAASKPNEHYLPIVKSLIRYGFSVDASDINDSDLVLNAIKMGYIEIIQDLIKHGLNKEKHLRSAVINEELEVAKFFVTNGADVNDIDDFGNTPVVYSMKNSDLDMCKLLLLHGANVEKYPELLRFAVDLECKEILAMLLERRVDIEATDVYGRTPLHLTVSRKYPRRDKFIHDYPPNIKERTEMAKILLAKGANVHAETNIERSTALHIACEEGFANIVEMLLQYQADVNCVSLYGTPLHCAARNRDDNKCFIEILLANKANINSKNENGDTALHIAVQYENTNIVETLVKNGADIDSKNNVYVTPLHRAINFNSFGAIYILLEHGCSINSKDINGNTPLHQAITSGHPFNKGCPERLLQFGSDINILNNNNHTPIDVAYHCVEKYYGYYEPDEYYGENIKSL